MASPDVRTFEDIHQIDPGLWDSLVPIDDLQICHRFVKSCQDSGVADARYWHLMVFDRRGLQCVASLSQMTISLELLSNGLTRATIHACRRLKPGFLQVPVLFCGLPVSFGQPCMRIRPGANVAMTLRAITSRMEEIAREQDVPIICFKEFDPQSAAEIQALCQLGYFRVRSLPSCSLPLRWNTFGDYLASTRAGYRRQIVGTLRVRETHELEVRVLEDFASSIEAIYSLYEEVMDRANHQLERLNRHFFEQLNENLAPQARAILLERHGKLLAAAVILTAPTVTTFLLTGIDYSVSHHYQVYPNLVLEVLAEAIRGGAKRVELGQTSYALKSRMGAQSVPRYLYLRHRSVLGHCLLRRASRFLFPAVKYPKRRVFKS